MTDLVQISVLEPSACWPSRDRGLMAACGGWAAARQLRNRLPDQMPGLFFDIGARWLRIGGQPPAEDDELTLDGGKGKRGAGLAQAGQERQGELIERARGWQHPGRPGAGDDDCCTA
jgi:hypothetical protein